MTDATVSRNRRVVIIGAGFGGLEAAKYLARAPVDIVLLDRNNYHGFWPLLYQVATSGIDPQQIAQPIRALVRRMPNLEFRRATVQSIDRADQVVHTDAGTFAYDELIVAPGSTTNFYGLRNVEAGSFELKDLPDALALRNHILTCFERATATSDPAMLQRLLTFVIVGGGPTGIEMAGAL